MNPTFATPATPATTAIPSFGLGTFRLTGAAATASVGTALKLGYRLIDTAQIYGNEADIGTAVAASGVPRDELFITTKIWTANLGAGQLLPSLKDSLQRLRTDRVDMALIHWPSPGSAVPVAESLQALAEAQAQGLTGLIGVSNFNIALLREAIAAVGAARIATNQVELHPFLQNRPLDAFARSQGIVLSSYMTLAYGKALDDPAIRRIAAARHATPAQVVLAWAMRLGHPVIPSSTRPEHLRSNRDACALQLDEADMRAIAALDRGERLVSPEGLAPAWD